MSWQRIKNRGWWEYEWGHRKCCVEKITVCECVCVSVMEKRAGGRFEG